MTVKHQVRNRSALGRPPSSGFINHDAGFGYPRDFLQNRWVYLVISSRAGGLSIGVNLNPVVKCSLNCAYCEVDRRQPVRASVFDSEVVSRELLSTLAAAYAGRLRELPQYARLPDPLLKVKQVALSGDGEPTLSEHFGEAVRTAMHVRATASLPFFKLVLITNSTALGQPEVRRGLSYFSAADEVWAKLDAGTQEYFTRVNGSTASLEDITFNILTLARERPVVIQSLFPAIDGTEPPEFEIDLYTRRLKHLKDQGAQIPLVQIYSAARPTAKAGCTHLPLRALSRIAQKVRTVTGLRAEVF